MKRFLGCVLVLFVAGALVSSVNAADKPDKPEKPAKKKADDGGDATATPKSDKPHYGDENLVRAPSKDTKSAASSTDTPHLYGPRPHVYDHMMQPYSLNPYMKPSPTYYRVSPFDTDSYFKGSTGN